MTQKCCFVYMHHYKMWQVELSFKSNGYASKHLSALLFHKLLKAEIYLNLHRQQYYI